MRRLTLPALAAFAVALLALNAVIIESRGQTPETQAAPQDLTPLLAKPTSEMRLVVTRYNADRNTLIGHFAGQSGRGGGGGRAGGAGAAGGPAAAPPATPVPISAARLARLKRYDLDWQSALTKIDSAKLSDLAKPDLVSLNTTVANNLKQIEADALTLAQITPVLPFASKIVGMVEARIRVDRMDAQKTAETTTAVVRELKQIRATLDSDAAEWARVRAIAPRAADAATQLRSAATEWFNFYNGYDPMFMWWVAMPYKQMDAGLQEYVTFLREKAAKSEGDAVASPGSVPPVTPVPVQKYASVPDLNEILALRQDELRDVVARFNQGRPGVGAGEEAASRQPRRPRPRCRQTITTTAGWLR